MSLQNTLKSCECSGLVDKLVVVIIGDWSDGHHVEVENKHIQDVIQTQNDEDDVNNEELEEYWSNNPQDDQDHRNGDIDVDVHRDDLGLNSVNGVDDEDCQEKAKKLK